MTHIIKIEAEDGHTLEAGVAGDPDTARGGVVVLQEIFGLSPAWSLTITQPARNAALR